MNKYLCTLCWLAVLLIAFASTKAKAEDLGIADDGGPNARITNITLVWDRNPEPDIAGYNVFRAICAGFKTQPEICKGSNVLDYLKKQDNFI